MPIPQAFGSCLNQGARKTAAGGEVFVPCRTSAPHRDLTIRALVCGGPRPLLLLLTTHKLSNVIDDAGLEAHTALYLRDNFLEWGGHPFSFSSRKPLCVCPSERQATLEGHEGAGAEAAGGGLFVSRAPRADLGPIQTEPHHGTTMTLLTAISLQQRLRWLFLQQQGQCGILWSVWHVAIHVQLAAARRCRCCTTTTIIFGVPYGRHLCS